MPARCSNARVTEDGLEMTFAREPHVLFRGDEYSEGASMGPAGASSRRRRTRTRARKLDFDDLQSENAIAASRLWPLQAVQHPVHARTGAPAFGHGHHGELPASRFRRHALRRREWRYCRFRAACCQEFRAHAGAGREDDHLSRELARRGRCQRRLFLQIQNRHADEGSTERRRRQTVVGRIGENFWRGLNSSPI
jgi:hypothetical protein